MREVLAHSRTIKKCTINEYNDYVSEMNFSKSYFTDPSQDWNEKSISCNVSYSHSNYAKLKFLMDKKII